METKPGISLAYLGGYFDGEGCVNINEGTGTTLYGLTVQISNTRREILDWCHSQFGGKIQTVDRNPGKHKPIHHWRVDSQKAEDFLVAIQPYVITKSEQIKLALYFRTLFKPPYALPRGRSNQDTDKLHKVLDMREKCYDKMKSLNKRGVTN